MVTKEEISHSSVTVKTDENSRDEKSIQYDYQHKKAFLQCGGASIESKRDPYETMSFPQTIRQGK